jgi:hypothetical protein
MTNVKYQMTNGQFFLFGICHFIKHPARKGMAQVFTNCEGDINEFRGF